MDVPELRCALLGWETQVHDTQLQDAEAQVFAGRGASAGMWACLRQDCLYSRNFAGREACYRCGAQRRAERSPSSRGSTSSARSSPSSKMLEISQAGRRNGSSWPRMHGTRLHASIAVLGRRWRLCGSFWRRRVRPGWWRLRRSRWPKQEVDTWATRLRRAGQCGCYAGDADWHAAAVGGGLCRGGTAGNRQTISVVAWVGLAGRDEPPPAGVCRRLTGSRSGQPRRRRPLELGCISTSMALALSRGPSAFAPVRAAAGRARRDPYQPPQLRVRGSRDGDREGQLLG